MRKAIALAEAEVKCKEKEEMTDWTNSLESLLFGQGCELVNIKLLRGSNPHVSLQDLLSEASLALSQVHSGNSDAHSDFPEDRNAKRTDISVLLNI